MDQAGEAILAATAELDPLDLRMGGYPVRDQSLAATIVGRVKGLAAHCLSARSETEDHGMDQADASRGPRNPWCCGSRGRDREPAHAASAMSHRSLFLAPSIRVHSSTTAASTGMMRSAKAFSAAAMALSNTAALCGSRRFSASAPRRFSTRVATLSLRSASSTVASHLRTFALPRAPNSRSTFSSIR